MTERIRIDEIFGDRFRTKEMASKAEWYEIYDRHGIYYDKKQGLKSACHHILHAGYRISDDCTLIAFRQDDEGCKQEIARARIKISLQIERIPDKGVSND